MSFFLNSNETFFPTDSEGLDIRKTLPNGVFRLESVPFKGFGYTKQDRFILPKKIYGNDFSRVDRIINTFEHREKSTGVLLTGEKGSGKTLLMKVLSEELYKKGVPTIIVNDQFSGNHFNDIISAVDTPALVVFDEFEKIYDDEDSQNQLLTLFDGLAQTKKLFCVTVNDIDSLSEYMINRPGRFYYQFSYHGLTNQFVIDYCNDTLKDKTQIDNVLKLFCSFCSFNFDMLQALIEEMNRYNENPFEAVKYLNIDVKGNIKTYKYEIKNITLNGENIFDILVEPYVLKGRYFNPIFHISSVFFDPVGPFKDSNGTKMINFSQSDIVSSSFENTSYVKNDEEYGLFNLTISRIVEEQVDMMKYMSL